MVPPVSKVIWQEYAPTPVAATDGPATHVALVATSVLSPDESVQPPPIRAPSSWEVVITAGAWWLEEIATPTPTSKQAARATRPMMIGLRRDGSSFADAPSTASVGGSGE